MASKKTRPLSTGRYLACPEDPIRLVLKAMTGAEPPAFVRGYSFKGLSEDQTAKLQNWCVEHVRPDWLTGIGLMDAAENQVEEAVCNGNIPAEGADPV